MAHNVQIVFTLYDLSAINLRRQNDFIIHVRARKKIAKRINDTAATACDDPVWVLPKIAIVVTRKIPATIELIAREHKAPSLHGDVPHRSEPRLAAVRGGGAINLDALRVHRRPHQG